MTDIRAIEARAAAATPGPWFPGDCGAIQTYDETTGYMVDDGLTNADSAFIAHARDDIPALLALTKQLADALGLIAHSGLDCPAAMSPESFYREQASRSIGTATRALTAYREATR